MDEDGNTDIVESKDIEMQTCSDRRQNEHSRYNAGYHKAVIRKPFVEASGRLKGTHATKSTRLSLSRKAESVTYQRSGFDPIRAAQKRTSPIETK